MFFVSIKCRFPSNCLSDAIGAAGPPGVNLPDDQGAELRFFFFFSLQAEAQLSLRASPAGLEVISSGHLAELSPALLPELWAARHSPVCPGVREARIARPRERRGG